MSAKIKMSTTQTGFKSDSYDNFGEHYINFKIAHRNAHQNFENF